jgi:hypothetical protein
LLFFLLQILGEMVNLQKVNWPKSLAKKVNSLKAPNRAFWLFYAQVDFLPSWLFGRLTFWRLTISPSIVKWMSEFAVHFFNPQALTLVFENAQECTSQSEYFSEAKAC